MKNNNNIPNLSLGLIHVHDRAVSRISTKDFSLWTKIKVVMLLLFQMLSGKCLGMAISEDEIFLLKGDCREHYPEQPLVKIQDWASKVYIAAKSAQKIDSSWCLIFVKAPNKTWRQLIVKDDIVFYDRNLGTALPKVNEEVCLAKSFLSRYGLKEQSSLMVVKIGEELPDNDLTLEDLNLVIKRRWRTPFYLLPHKLIHNLLAGIIPLMMKSAICLTTLVGLFTIAPKVFAIKQTYSQVATLEKKSNTKFAEKDIRIISIYSEINKSNPNLKLILANIAGITNNGELRVVAWKNNQLSIGSIVPINVKKVSESFPNYKVVNVIKNPKDL